jgi:hypothetical protein
LKNGADFESAVRETVLRLRGIFRAFNYLG